MKVRRGEWAVLTSALVLYVLMLVLHQGPFRWGQAVLYFPTGLLLLSATNVFLRAKVLAWGIFSVAFVVFMILLGTWVVMDRAMKGPPPTDFLRSIALYLSLATAGLMQLRVSSRSKGEGPK